MRVSGLASGMDTEQIIKDLMKAERIPLDKLKQKKQILEWQRDDYRSVNTALLNFRQGILMEMKLSSSYRTKLTSSTNEAMVSATATSGAGTSSYQLSNVRQLATAATRITNNSLSADPQKKTDPSKSLSSSGFASGISWKKGSVGTAKLTGNESAEYQLANLNGAKITDFDNMTVKVDNKVYQVVTGTDVPGDGQVHVGADGKLTFKNPVAKNSTIEVNYVTDKQIDAFSLKKDAKEFSLSKGGPIENVVTLSIGNQQVDVAPDDTFSINGLTGKLDRTTGKITLDSPLAEDTDLKVSYEEKYTDFGIQTSSSDGAAVNEKFLISSRNSLNDVINKVNASKVGVTMFYDSYSDKLSLTRKETGDFNKGGQEIITTGSFLNDVLQFGGSTETGGQNAKFTINGLETERTGNTFTMNGVTFTLKQTFTEPVSIGVSNNTSTTFDHIKNFVTKYNELIDTIQKKTSEERFRSYKPLTDEEREALDEKQIEQWEEKAKSGLLRNDSILSGLLTSMRSSFSNPVSSSSGVFKQLSSIGITTTKNYLEGGKLEINEEKLRKALEEDPEGVESLFNSPNGIAQQLTESINQASNKLKDRAGTALSTNTTFTIGRSLSDVSDRISSFEKRLLTVESRYYRQFTAMEKAIQKANSQSGYLSQMFTAG